MKAYNFVFALVALIASGCSKSGETIGAYENDSFQSADYVVLVKQNGSISAQLFNVSKDNIRLNKAKTEFEEETYPKKVIQEGAKFNLYGEQDNCPGIITQHDFDTDSCERFDLFPEEECPKASTAFLSHGTQFYVGFELENDDLNPQYGIKIGEIVNNELIISELLLEHMPVQMLRISNFLFVLTKDEVATKEYQLIVVNIEDYSKVYEKDLGFNVGHLFVNERGNIVIPYKKLHTEFSVQNWSVTYTNYEVANTPGFYNSENRHFITNGNLYYIKEIEGEIYSSIPAIFDFNTNTTTLLYYSNFLTTAELVEQYKIGYTTMVRFDKERNELLVGYKKNDSGVSGGLLRLVIEPELKLVGQVDVSGIPYYVHFK